MNVWNPKPWGVSNFVARRHDHAAVVGNFETTADRPFRWEIRIPMSGFVIRAVCYALLLFVLTSRIASGQSFTASPRLEAHAQARALAHELVASIFDVQLRHLEENGLAEQPLYAEIRASRDTIDGLASNEMERLTSLLTRLQDSRGGDGGELFAEARLTARRIAVSMMAVRQRLRGRVRTSRTLMLLRQMVAHQEQSIVATEQLRSRPDADRRRHVEQLVQSHLDLAVLYEQLVMMLEDARETLAEDRFGAVAALDRFAADRTEACIADATDLLKSGHYEDARHSEQKVVDSLAAVLRLLQQGDKLAEEARRKAIEAIERTSKEQQTLRRATVANQLADSSDRNVLASKQRHIADQLEQLYEPLSQLAPVGEQLLAASAAAQQAGEHLGQAEKDQAIERQETVLSMLEDIARHLSADALDSAALADRAAQLEELSMSLNELLEKQAEASGMAATDPASAAELEAAIADSLQEADDASQLNGDIESRLDQAHDAVTAAQQALEDSAPDAQQNRLEAVEHAETALLEAAAEVQSQRSDVQQALAGNPTETNASSENTSKGEASDGTTRDSGSARVAEQAEDIESRSFENEAWFARLPATLQDRIRAATRRPAPRGYEERLQRYFQTSD